MNEDSQDKKSGGAIAGFMSGLAKAFCGSKEKPGAFGGKPPKGGY
jgi:hypothetical protein